MESHDPTPMSPSGDENANPSTSAVPVVSPGSHRIGAVRLWALGGRRWGSSGFLAADRDHAGQLQTQGHGQAVHGLQFHLFRVGRASHRRNAECSIGLGVTGATVGLALGLAGGLARHSVRAGIMAAVLGLVLGTAAGAGAALAAVPLASQVRERDPGNMSVEMFSSLLVHGVPWAAVFAVGGLAFGIGLGGRDRAGRGLVVGLLGALAGAFLFEIIGALALPDSKMSEPIAATWAVRLLAQCFAIMPPAAGIAALVSYPADRRS